MDEELRTERLLLRRARMEDAPAMHALMSNPLAMRYWSTLPHADSAETEAWMESMVHAPAEESDDFIVTLDGTLIGKLGAWRLPEVGFLIDPAVWGRGLGFEAMTAFVTRRSRLGSTELTADVDPRNGASLRLLQRCGFRETHRARRTWEIGGEWFDSVYLRREF